MLSQHYRLRRILALSLVASFVTHAEKVDAATFTTFAQLGSIGCNLADSGPTGASSTCGSVELGGLVATASSSAGNGSLSANASSVINRTQAGVQTSTGFAKSSALMNDVLRITGISSGSVLFNLDYQGSLFSIVNGENGAFSTVSTGFNVNSTTYFSGNGNLASNTLNGVFGVQVPLFDGVLRLQSGITVSAKACNFVRQGSTCFAEAEYGSSLRFLGISIFDENGVDVTSLATVTSDSGFDYVKGAEPHDRPQVVPIPAASLMLLSALLVLGRFRKS